MMVLDINAEVAVGVSQRLSCQDNTMVYSFALRRVTLRGGQQILIKVDLNSKIVTPSQNVYMVRPGSNYKLYNLFQQEEAIFADLLGLELTAGISLEKQDRIIPQLHRARKLRSVRNKDTEPASRNLDDYSDFKDDNSIRQLNLILRAFFRDAKRGDVVLIPSPTFAQDALIGELISEPTDFSVVSFKGEKLYGRKVKWLGRLPRGKLSPYLLDLISKPNAFVQIKEEERPSIYREAYGNYIIPGLNGAPAECRSRFNVDDPEFTTTDDLYIQAFFNFVAANSKRIRSGETDLLEIKTAAFERLTGSDALDLQSNINSPGFLNLISPNMGALVTSALFTIAVVVGPGAVEAAENGTIVIGNGDDPNDPCSVAVNQEVLQHLRLLGVGKWPEACAIARQANASTGLRGQAKVVVEQQTVPTESASEDGQ